MASLAIGWLRRRMACETHSPMVTPSRAAAAFASVRASELTPLMLQGISILLLFIFALAKLFTQAEYNTVSFRHTTLARVRKCVYIRAYAMRIAVGWGVAKR